MFRMGLSGTNWTGKTETIRRVVRAHPDVAIETVSLSELVRESPYPMGEKQTLEASRWMTEQVWAICQKSNRLVQLFDRTPIDILAFTLYIQDRTRVNDGGIIESILDLVRCFDVLLYIPVSKGWPDNVTAGQKTIRFAERMDSYIRRAIEEYTIDVAELPWSRAERENVISAYLPHTQTA